MSTASIGTCELLTRGKALSEGLNDAAIRRLVHAGHLVVLRRGIYVRAADFAEIAGDPARRHAIEIRALVSALSRRHIAAAGNSAARILGLEFLDRPNAGLVVVTSDPGVAGTARDGYTLRVASLPPGHVVHQFGAPLTSPARTLLDLCAEQDFPGAVVLTDSAARRGLVTLSTLTAALDEAAGRPGIQQARAVFAFIDPAAESPLESASRAVIHLLGLPAPQTQISFRGGLIRVDFFWADFDVIGEADGLGKYLDDGGRGTARTVREEKAREQSLLDLNKEIVRWGWDEVRNPPVLEARLRAAFARGLARRRGRGV